METATRSLLIFCELSSTTCRWKSCILRTNVHGKSTEISKIPGHILWIHKETCFIDLQVKNLQIKAFKNKLSRKRETSPSPCYRAFAGLLARPDVAVKRAGICHLPVRVFVFFYFMQAIMDIFNGKCVCVNCYCINFLFRKVSWTFIDWLIRHVTGK